MTLNGEILKAYNNLPAIPIEQPLGDLLNTIPVGNPALENPVGGTATLYVSATGSDDTGDGSQGNPYATPQAAIDAIPSTAAKGTTFIVQCGAGSFPFPDVQRVPANVTLRIIGDTSAPVLSIPAGTVPFTALPGKLSRFTGNVGAYSATITDGSHWIGFFATGQAPSLAFLATASTAPALNVVTTFDIFAFRNAVVCPYSTSFTVSGNFNSIASVAFREGQAVSNINFIGISVEAAAGNSGFLKAKGVSFYACRFVQGSGNFLSVTYQDSGQSFIYFDGVNAGLTLIDAYLGHSYLKSSSTSLYGTEVFSGGVYYPMFAVGDLRFVTADFESAGGGTAISLGFGAPYLQLSAGITVDPALAGFINCSSSQNASIQLFQTVTGSVTGNAIVLTNGAQARGVEAACSGNLTAGGSEIVVGGNAGQTFASLPATDLAAASPQLCRAT